MGTLLCSRHRRQAWFDSLNLLRYNGERGGQAIEPRPSNSTTRITILPIAGVFTPCALSLVEWLQFYRLQDWEHKINLTRLLLYVVLGWAAAGTTNIQGLLRASAALAAVLMFAGAWSDYWDFRIEGQRNRLSTLVQGGRLPVRFALPLALAPLPAAAVFMWAGSRVAVEPAVGLLLVFLLGFLALYAAPPVRFKARVPFGFFAAPIGAAATVLIGWGMVAPWNAVTIPLAALVLLFHCYAECLHVLDDVIVPGETRKLSVQAAQGLVRWFPLGSAACAAIFSVRHPMFLLGVLCGFVRRRALSRLQTHDNRLHAARTNLFNPVFCLPEFLAYAIVGWLGALR